MSGYFITFEGGDGTGKSTQVRLLVSRLKEMGVKVIQTREPGGSEGAESIRALILSTMSTWCMRTEALLFAAARTDHVEKIIAPAIASGTWVICDRYLDSSRAYQGAAGGLGDEHMMALHGLGAKLIPHRTILLQLPLDTGTQRANGEGDAEEVDRILARGDSYHSSVCDAYRRFAEQDPDRIRTVNASGTMEEVHQRVLDQVIDLLPED